MQELMNIQKDATSENLALSIYDKLGRPKEGAESLVILLSRWQMVLLAFNTSCADVASYSILLRRWSTSASKSSETEAVLGWMAAGS